MKLSPEQLQFLADKGLTLGEVIEFASLTPDRTPGAVRQARYRAKQKANGHASDVTGDVTSDGVTHPPDKEIPPTPPKEIKPPLTPVNSNELTPPAEDFDGEKVSGNEVIEGWNALARRCGLPAVKKLTPDRRRKLAGRIRDHPLSEWQTAFAAIERSPFLRGSNNRGWRADFDFLLSPSKFVKLIEGHYDHEPAN